MERTIKMCHIQAADLTPEHERSASSLIIGAPGDLRAMKVHVLSLQAPSGFTPVGPPRPYMPSQGALPVAAGLTPSWAKKAPNVWLFARGARCAR